MEKEAMESRGSVVERKEVWTINERWRGGIKWEKLTREQMRREKEVRE